MVKLRAQTRRALRREVDEALARFEAERIANELLAAELEHARAVIRVVRCACDQAPLG